MAKRNNVLPDLDENAPEPVMAGKHDVDHVMRLLAWGRKHGYALGPTLQVGGVIVQVKDIRLARREALRDKEEPEADIYGELGLDDDEPAEGTAA